MLNELKQNKDSDFQVYQQKVKSLDTDEQKSKLDKLNTDNTSEIKKLETELEGKRKALETQKQDISDAFQKRKIRYSKFDKIHFVLIFDVSGSMLSQMNTLKEGHNSIKQFYTSY